MIGQVGFVKFSESVEFFAMPVEKLFDFGGEFFGDAALGRDVKFVQADAMLMDGGVLLADIKGDNFVVKTGEEMLAGEFEHKVDIKLLKRVFEGATDEAGNKFNAAFEVLIKFVVGIEDESEVVHILVVVIIDMAFVSDRDRIVKGVDDAEMTNGANLVELFRKSAELVEIIDAVCPGNLFRLAERALVARFAELKIERVVQFFFKESSE